MPRFKELVEQGRQAYQQWAANGFNTMQKKKNPTGGEDDDEEEEEEGDGDKQDEEDSLPADEDMIHALSFL